MRVRKFLRFLKTHREFPKSFHFSKVKAPIVNLSKWLYFSVTGSILIFFQNVMIVINPDYFGTNFHFNPHKIMTWWLRRHPNTWHLLYAGVSLLEVVILFIITIMCVDKTLYGQTMAPSVFGHQCSAVVTYIWHLLILQSGKCSKQYFYYGCALWQRYYHGIRKYDGLSISCFGRSQSRKVMMVLLRSVSYHV